MQTTDLQPASCSHPNNNHMTKLFFFHCIFSSKWTPKIIFVQTNSPKKRHFSTGTCSKGSLNSFPAIFLIWVFATDNLWLNIIFHCIWNFSSRIPNHLHIRTSTFHVLLLKREHCSALQELFYGVLLIMGASNMAYLLD